MKVYLDLVFAANFLGDFLCLALTGSLYMKSSLLRIAAASFLGGIYGTVCVLPGFGFLSSLPAKAFAGFLLTAAAYAPVPFRQLARLWVTFIISSMLLCGAADFIIGRTPAAHAFFAVLFCACVLYCLFTVFKNRICSKYLACELCFGGKKVKACGFYDSGNRLGYDHNAMRVIVADESILKQLCGENACLLNLCEWTDTVELPFSGAAGGVLTGIRLDYVKVGGSVYRDVILGISAGPLPEKLILHCTMAG